MFNVVLPETFNVVRQEIAARCYDMFGVALIDRYGYVTLAETTSNLINARDVAALCNFLSQQSQNNFKIWENDGQLIGYSENDMDWVVAKTSHEMEPFISALLDSIWYSFFDYA